MPWNIIGHQWAVNLLKRGLASDRLRHAYLFTGPPGIGKRTLALTLARALNCEASSTANEAPCGTCRACRLIAGAGHPDVVTVQAESSTLKVAQVRALQKQLSLTPNEGRHRIALILRFHEASASAANALLKTLEEPPARVKLLLTATSVGELLPTIVSRCEVLALRPLPLEEVRSALVDRWSVDPERAELLARLSGGRPGWAINTAGDQPALERRLAILSEHRQLLDAPRVARFACAESLAKNKESVPEVLAHWLSYWRDVLLATCGAEVPLVNVDHEAQIRALAAGVEPALAHQAIQAIRESISRLDRNVNLRLTLETLMLDLPH